MKYFFGPRHAGTEGNLLLGENKSPAAAVCSARFTNCAKACFPSSPWAIKLPDRSVARLPQTAPPLPGYSNMPRSVFTLTRIPSFAHRQQLHQHSTPLFHPQAAPSSSAPSPSNTHASGSDSTSTSSLPLTTGSSDSETADYVDVQAVVRMCTMRTSSSA